MIGKHPMSPQFMNRQSTQDTGANHEATQTQAAEEMHRSGEVFEQKLNGEDVEHHVESAAQAVVRVARDTRRVADGDLGDSRAVETGQRRNETMQFTV